MANNVEELARRLSPPRNKWNPTHQEKALQANMVRILQLRLEAKRLRVIAGIEVPCWCGFPFREQHKPRCGEIWA